MQEYQDFFVGIVGLGGALIGLLFVAMSVAPQMAKESSEVEVRIRSGIALVAFTNPLMMALFGLVPTLDFATAVIYISITSLLSLISLCWLWMRDPDTGNWTGKIFLTVVVLIIPTIEIISAIGLTKHRNNTGDLTEICVMMILFVFVGIIRAWHLIGQRHRGFLHTFLAASRGSHSSSTVGPASGADAE